MTATAGACGRRVQKNRRKCRLICSQCIDQLPSRVSSYFMNQRPGCAWFCVSGLGLGLGLGSRLELWCGGRFGRLPGGGLGWLPGVGLRRGCGLAFWPATGTGFPGVRRRPALPVPGRGTAGPWRWRGRRRQGRVSDCVWMALPAVWVVVCWLRVWCRSWRSWLW